MMISRSRTPPRRRPADCSGDADYRSRNWCAGAVCIHLRNIAKADCGTKSEASVREESPEKFKKTQFRDTKRIKLNELIPETVKPFTAPTQTAAANGKDETDKNGKESTWPHLLLGRLLDLENRVSKVEKKIDPRAVGYSSLLFKLQPSDVLEGSGRDLARTVSSEETCGEQSNTSEPTIETYTTMGIFKNTDVEETDIRVSEHEANDALQTLPEERVSWADTFDDVSEESTEETAQPSECSKLYEQPASEAASDPREILATRVDDAPLDTVEGIEGSSIVLEPVVPTVTDDELETTLLFDKLFTTLRHGGAEDTHFEALRKVKLLRESPTMASAPMAS